MGRRLNLIRHSKNYLGWANEALLRSSSQLKDSHCRDYYTRLTKSMYQKHEEDMMALKDEGRKKRRILSFKKKTWKFLRILERAHSGDPAFHSVLLSYAYGRRGSSRHELLTPLTLPTQSSVRLLPHLHRTRFPFYPPAFSTLLFSSFSNRKTSFQSLLYPPNLPSKGIPGSKERMVNGALTARRQTRPRWRWWNQRVKGVMPPVEVQVFTHGAKGQVKIKGKEAAQVWRAWGGVDLPLQEENVLEKIERIARTGIEKEEGDKDTENGEKWERPAHKFLVGKNQHKRVPRRRTIKRRYQALLADIPIFSVTVPDEPAPFPGGKTHKEGSEAHHHWRLKGLEQLKYNVNYSDHVIGGKESVRQLNEEETWWLMMEPEKKQKSP